MMSGFHLVRQGAFSAPLWVARVSGGASQLTREFWQLRHPTGTRCWTGSATAPRGRCCSLRTAPTELLRNARRR